MCRFDLDVDERNGQAVVATTEYRGASIPVSGPILSAVDLASGGVVASLTATDSRACGGSLTSPHASVRDGRLRRVRRGVRTRLRARLHHG